jgi:hypothetical protein
MGDGQEGSPRSTSSSLETDRGHQGAWVSTSVSRRHQSPTESGIESSSRQRTAQSCGRGTLTPGSVSSSRDWDERVLMGEASFSSASLTSRAAGPWPTGAPDASSCMMTERSLAAPTLNARNTPSPDTGPSCRAKSSCLRGCCGAGVVGTSQAGRLGPSLVPDGDAASGCLRALAIALLYLLAATFLAASPSVFRSNRRPMPQWHGTTTCELGSPIHADSMTTIPPCPRDLTQRRPAALQADVVKREHIREDVIICQPPYPVAVCEHRRHLEATGPLPEESVTHRDLRADRQCGL